MPTGIIPLTIAGAIDPTSPSVESAYIPGVDFTFTCPYLALPSNCTARILPSQINAIVSELIALAECFDPDGVWDCTVLNNLCVAFTNFLEGVGPGSLSDQVQNILCGVSVEAVDENSGFLFCNGSGEIHKSDLPISNVLANSICDDPIAVAALNTCIVPRGVLIDYDEFVPIATPTDLPAGGAILDSGTIIIPNGSLIPVPAWVYIELIGGMKQVTPGTLGLLKVDVWNDAGFTDNYTTLIMRYDFTGGAQTFANRTNVIKANTIFPGGKQLWWTLEGRATNTGDWRVVEAGTSLIANIKFRVNSFLTPNYDTYT